jgi:hypothetical protein
MLKAGISGIEIMSKNLKNKRCSETKRSRGAASILFCNNGLQSVDKKTEKQNREP